MLNFYKRTLLLLITAALLTTVVVYAGRVVSRIDVDLFPHNDNAIPFLVDKEPKVPKENAFLNIDKAATDIEFTFSLTSEVNYPYAAYILNFYDAPQNNGFIDLTKYQGVKFRVQCSTKNVLVFSVFTFDQDITVPEDTSTHRIASAFYTCDKHWNAITFNFDDLETPDWWLEKFDLHLTDRSYKLRRVSSFRFTNSVQTQKDKPCMLKFQTFNCWAVLRFMFIYLILFRRLFGGCFFTGWLNNISLLW